MKEFVTGKKYVFKEALLFECNIANKFDDNNGYNESCRDWSSSIDNMEVSFKTPHVGTINKLFISPDWCEEVKE